MSCNSCVLLLLLLLILTVKKLVHSKCVSGGGQLINSNVSSTVVWVANGNQPISQTAYLDFLPNGTLKLVGNDTLQPVDWVRPVNASSVRGELLNTGNFVLKNGFGNTTYLDLSFCAESMFLAMSANDHTSPLQGTENFCMVSDDHNIIKLHI
jgi:hypothetical protein